MRIIQGYEMPENSHQSHTITLYSSAYQHLSPTLSFSQPGQRIPPLQRAHFDILSWVYLEQHHDAFQRYEWCLQRE